MSTNTTLGLTLVGILFAGVLFGIFTAQVYVFHKIFPQESPWLKFGVVDTMWLLELSHTLCLFHLAYYYAVINIGDPQAIVTSTPPSFPASIFFHGFIAVLAQTYLVFRIARFSGHPLIPSICCILMACQLAFDIVVGAKAVTLAEKSVTEYLQQTRGLILTPLVLRAVVDIIISVTLVYYLLCHRRGSAYRNTTAVIDKLILWSIETGVITSMLGVAVIICYLVDIENYAWVALYVVFPKILSNTLLRILNARVELRQMQSTMILTTGGFGIADTRTSLQFANRANSIEEPETDTRKAELPVELSYQ